MRMLLYGASNFVIQEQASAATTRYLRDLEACGFTLILGGEPRPPVCLEGLKGADVMVRAWQRANQ